MEKEKFEFIGGSLCLDLANTIGGARNRASETDHLTSYDDLLHWTHEAGLISEMVQQHLEAMALSDSPGASDVLARVKALRGVIYRIFSSIPAGNSVPDTDLQLLNEEIERCFQRSRIIRTSEGYAWGWAKELTLDCMIAPIVRSAADVLTTSSALGRIRECASDNCSWLFLDETKNRSRRWCNMKTCGNAHKVNRYRARQTGKLN